MSQTIYPLSQWSFNQEVSCVFDNHVKKSVPHYGTIQHIITQLSDFFVQPNGVVYDIGCATGETINQINQRHHDKKVQFIGIDESSAMLEQAIEKTGELENVQFVQESIVDFHFVEQSNLIIAVLTLQFIPIHQRKQVIQNIYDSLQKGGAFLFVEKCYPGHPKTQEIFKQLYHDDKESNGLTSQEIREKDKSLRGVLNPLTVSENIQLLEETGFTTIETFFSYLQFTGFLAMK